MTPEIPTTQIRSNFLLFYIGSIIALILKIVLDAIFVLADRSPASFGLISSPILALSFVSGAFIARFSQISTSIEQHRADNAGKLILDGGGRIILITLIVLLGGSLLLVSFADNDIPSGMFESFIMNLIGAVFLYVAIETILFIYFALYIRRHEKTKKFSKVLAVGTLIIYGLVLLGKFAENTNNPLAGIAAFVLCILLLLTIGRTKWVALLTKQEKKKLAWQSALGFFVFTFLSVQCFEKNGFFSKPIEFFLYGSSTIAGVSMMFSAIYSARLFFPALVALPTASAVDRRNSEVSSLTHLNKIIAETIDFDMLIENLTQRALEVSRATSAWCELYSPTNERAIASLKYINQEQIDWLYSYPAFERLIERTNSTTLIVSFDEEKDLAPIAAFPKPIARSLIIVPLYEGLSKIGALIVLNTQSFGFENDDMNVLSSFGDNISVALKNARLIRESISHERIQHEIQVARQIQNKLLPQKIPTISGYDIAPFSLPANEVGGDYYDVVTLQDGKIAIFMGDVSGKGVPAAFYMAELKGVVLALAQEVRGARDFLCKINATLFGNIERQTYITLSCVVIEPNSPKISLARAGHMPFLVKQHGGVSVVTPRGLGIGLAKPEVFDRLLEEYFLDLAVGDACFLFTDGLSERQNSQDKDFGYEPILDILRSPSAESAHSIIKEVMKAVEYHAGSFPQHDDMTCLAFIYRNNGENNMNINLQADDNLLMIKPEESSYSS
jgi:serine phosphatase RsbU (regulator of sigma subunit)/fumarate reductase subunit D